MIVKNYLKLLNAATSDDNIHHGIVNEKTEEIKNEISKNFINDNLQILSLLKYLELIGMDEIQKEKDKISFEKETGKWYYYKFIPKQGNFDEKTKKYPIKTVLFFELGKFEITNIRLDIIDFICTYFDKVKLPDNLQNEIMKLLIIKQI